MLAGIIGKAIISVPCVSKVSGLKCFAREPGHCLNVQAVAFSQTTTCYSTQKLGRFPLLGICACRTKITGSSLTI